jgi:hypothetical protein
MRGQDSPDYSLLKKYLKEDGGLDYSVLWSEVSSIQGFNHKNRQEKHFRRIKDAYERYSNYIKEGSTHNTNVD